MHYLFVKTLAMKNETYSVIGNAVCFDVGWFSREFTLLINIENG